MKNITLHKLLILFIFVVLFFVPTVSYAAYTTFSINSPTNGAVYNRGDTVFINGSVSSTVCSNDMADIPITYILGVTQIGTGNMTAVGGSTLEWQNTVTIPSNTPCGPTTLKMQWTQNVYNKGTGALIRTDSGEQIINVTIGGVGTCGSANGQTYAISPTTNLCSVGTASNVSSTGIYWKWKCNALNTCDNGSTQCTANNTSLAGACGTNNKAYAAGSTTFFGTFCTNNLTPTPNNPVFPTVSVPTTWTCPNGVSNVSCSATLSGSGCP
jgi:hypothetical protein